MDYLSKGISMLDTSHVTTQDIQQIYEVEKDMWARGLGEYVQCRHCSTISGKEDVFDETLLRDFPKKTTTEIEEILGIESLKCPCCGGETEFSFPETYQESIWERYTANDSFLVVFRDTHNKIRGFFDGYVSSFDVIFSNEFHNYYGGDSKTQIKKAITNSTNENIPDTILCLSALGTDNAYQKLEIIYELMKTFFFYVSTMSHAKGISGIYESVIGTNTHAIYEVLGGYPLGFQGVSKYRGNSNIHYESDIFFHTDIATKSYVGLGDNLRQFLGNNRGQIRSIITKK